MENNLPYHMLVEANSFGVAEQDIHEEVGLVVVEHAQDGRSLHVVEERQDELEE